MVTFKPLVLLFATVSATPLLSKRATFGQVMQDVTNIDENVKHLIKLTRAYQGGILGATPQLATLSAVYIALGGGDVHSALLPPSLSEAQANELIQHVNVTLAVDNPIAVDTLISKKEKFEEAHIAKAIVPALELLLAGHESFSKHVMDRIPEETLERGMAVVEIISDALRKGIRTFKE